MAVAPGQNDRHEACPGRVFDASPTGAPLLADRRSRRREDLAAAVIMFLVPFLVYSFLWLGKRQSLGFDYGWVQPGCQLLFLQSMRDGFFPLWAPGDCAGMPFVSYFPGEQFSPLTWLMSAFESTFRGRQVDILTSIRLLTLGMTGFFTYLVTRRWGLGVIPGVTAGIVFVCNLHTLDCFRTASALDSVVWFPVMIYLAERSAAGPRLTLVAWYALAQHMMIAGGHVQKAFYCICFTNAYFLARLMTRIVAENREHRLAMGAKRWVYFSFGQALGLALSAVALVPLRTDLVPLWQHRSQGGADYYFRWHMTGVDAVCNLFYPWIADVNSAWYVGQAAWALALLGIGMLAIDRKRLAAPERILLLLLSCAFAFSILYSMGPLTPVAELANSVTPIMRTFRAPGRIMVVGVFGVAGLAAFAVERILRYTDKRSASFGILGACWTACLLAGLALAAALVIHEVEWGPAREGIYRGLWLPILGGITHRSPARLLGDTTMLPAMAVTIVAVALLNITILVAYRRAWMTATTMVGLLLIGLVVESSVYHRRGTQVFTGRHESAQSATFKEVDLYHSRLINPQPMFLWSSRDIVQKPLPDGTMQFGYDRPHPIEELLAKGGLPAWWLYYQNVKGHEIPRAYVTPHVRLIRGDALTAMRGMNPYDESILDVSDPVNAGAGSQPALIALDALKSPTGPSQTQPAQVPSPETLAAFRHANAGVRVEVFTPNKAAFKVRSVRGGLFNYSDAWATGWRAAIDGVPTPLYRTNSTFKSVVLPPGEHRIEFVYDPSSVRVGLAISLAGACVWLGLMATALGPAGGRRTVIALLVTLLAVPVAWHINHRLYEMAHRDGMINFNPDSPRPYAPNYDEYLKTAVQT